VDKYLSSATNFMSSNCANIFLLLSLNKLLEYFFF
jgi:hypothetical protein